jgi:predicted amidohydrolase
MRVGFVQFEPVFGEKQKNLDKVENIISGADADLLVLPELFNTGYLFADRNELFALSENTDGESITRLKSIAKKNNIAIAAGFAERFSDKQCSDDRYKIFNSQVFVKPDGTHHIYRKIHLFDSEKLIFDPGDIKPNVVEYNGVKFGMLICFDWLFPEIYRRYAMLGADVICHSTNLVLPYCQRASFARAVENRMYIVLANRTGRESRNKNTLTFTGGSIIYSPKGDVMAQTDEKKEIVSIVEIDVENSRNKYITERNHLLNDRRPEMYEL